MAEMRNDIKTFLDEPTPAHQVHLARMGPAIIPAGLSHIAERLRVLGERTMHPSFYTFTGIDDGKIMQAFGVKWLMTFQDVIVQIGAAGIDCLIDVIKRNANPDVQALAAIELATKDLVSPQAYPFLFPAFSQARTTGLQLALALALLAHGDCPAIKTLAVPYLASSYEEISALLEKAKRSQPETDWKIVEQTVYGVLALPKVIQIVVMDIASNGRAPQASWPTWRRE